MGKEIPFKSRAKSDLYLDALYKSGTNNNFSDEPIGKLMGVMNQRGFRMNGSYVKDQLNYLVLVTTLSDLDWPDSIELDLGKFIYYGDNRTPGKSILNTTGKGNAILEKVFNSLHSGNRKDIPPFFIFSYSGKGRDAVFRGLAAPGYPGLSNNEDLVAIWKSKRGKRFQNYKSTFTILSEGEISRAWLKDLQDGRWDTSNCPESWRTFVNKGKYNVLTSERTHEHRKKEEQVPTNSTDKKLLKAIYNKFKSAPYAFEEYAIEIARKLDPNIVELTQTRKSKDGGRDGIGTYQIGTGERSLLVEFALEAKCYEPSKGCGVKETSRLISRLRHRQFGILVTTSYLSEQAYKEIVEDEHPIIIISGKDIVELSKK